MARTAGGDAGAWSQRLLLCLLLPAWTVFQTDGGLRTEIESLNQAMTAALQRDPASVAAFYTDHAAIIGAGQRHQGRAAVAEYWKGGGMFADWRLELLAAGRPAHAPWQYGRSVLTGRSGRTMETYFVGRLRRQPAGDLKFQVDVFVREGGGEGGAEATALTESCRSARGVTTLAVGFFFLVDTVMIGGSESLRLSRSIR